MKKLNILHVDDSEKIKSLLKLSLLARHNIGSIDEAGTLNLAKRKLAIKPADVVILDLDLPDGRGIDLLVWIKKEYPGTTVIMFTNHSDSYHRSVSLQYGADYFFDKVTEFENIAKTLSILQNK